jgi:hypothetical protein
MTISMGTIRPGATQTTQAKPKAAAPMAAIRSINVKWCRDGVMLCFRSVDQSARHPHCCAFEGLDCKNSSLVYPCRAAIMVARLGVRGNCTSALAHGSVKHWICIVITGQHRRPDGRARRCDVSPTAKFTKDNDHSTRLSAMLHTMLFDSRSAEVGRKPLGNYGLNVADAHDGDPQGIIVRITFGKRMSRPHHLTPPHPTIR